MDIALLILVGLAILGVLPPPVPQATQQSAK
jgi:hypothetical protein